MEDHNDTHFQGDAFYFPALYNAPSPIVVASEDGRFLLINRAFQAAVGFTPSEIRTFDDWIDRMGVEDPDGVAAYLEGLFSAECAAAQACVALKDKRGRVLAWEFFSAPMGRAGDGRRLAISIASSPADDAAPCEAAVGRLAQEVTRRSKDLQESITALENEISERRRVERALTRSRERLRQLSIKVLDMLEADRKTVSKELHDSIGASLAAIKFSLEEKEIDREQQDGRLRESLSREIEYLSSAIKETKRISANLRPTTLDDLGLMATLKWYLRQFQRMYGNIRVDFTSEVTEADVPEAMKIIVYRIVQEGLSNAEKHSDATSVRLHLSPADGSRTLVLVIEDDGRGFDVRETLSEKDPLSGYGLTAMRERCEIVGGSFHIHSQPGQGTVIRAMLPR